MTNKQNPTAHLLHGFVGAGKTTFARRLEAEHRAVRFTHDEWMHSLYGDNPPADQFTELYDRVDALIWTYALRLLELGTDVILDSGFWSRDSRATARQRVIDAGAEPRLYFIDTPESIMRERILKRTDDLPSDSLKINSGAFELFKKRFEELDPDEAFVHINGQ